MGGAVVCVCVLLGLPHIQPGEAGGNGVNWEHLASEPGCLRPQLEVVLSASSYQLRVMLCVSSARVFAPHNMHNILIATSKHPSPFGLSLFTRYK